MSQGTTELERPVPLYMQVVRQLRAQIASGQLAEGDRIPSQREMMQRWHISMQTASKVIGALKTEGLAIPSVGRDTIVAPGAAARIAAAATGTAHASTEPQPAPGLDAKVTTGRSAAPAHVAEILGLPANRRVLHRRETRPADGEPVSVTTTWFSQAIADKAPQLADSHPLPAGALAYIAEATGERAVRITEENAAVPAGEDAARLLGVPPGSPVLATRTRYNSTTGQVIAYAERSTTTGHSHTRTYTITGN